MTHRCFSERELAELAALPPSAPRRRDAAACPRCDGMLRELAAFLDGDPALPAAETARAERHLAAVLATHLASHPATATAAAPQPASRPPAPPPVALRRVGPGRRWWGWGTAVAAAAALAFVVWRPAGDMAPSGTLRHAGGPATARIEGVAVVADVADGLRLSWPSVAAAGTYDVVVFDAALDTVAVLADLPTATALISGELTHSLGADGGFVRVRAWAGDLPLAASPLVPLPGR